MPFHARFTRLARVLPRYTLTAMRLFTSVPPTPGPDPRQAQYRDTVAKAMEQFKSLGLEPAALPPLEGFLASAVDLGWIQDQIGTFVRGHAPSLEELGALLEAELPQVVQRVKEVTIGNIGWP